MAGRIPTERAEDLAEKMATGTWTHDYPISALEAKELGLLVGARASVVHALQHTRGATPDLAGVSESDLGNYQQSLRDPASDEIATLLATAGLDSARVSVLSQEKSVTPALSQEQHRAREIASLQTRSYRQALYLL